MTKDKVCIEFTDGKKINLELFREYAPESVENFMALVKDGFYDGLCFHRVIREFMIQGGGFTQSGGELIHKPAPRTIRGEFAANGVRNPLRHTPGVVSMARTPDPNSASSQFFICVEKLPYLDGQYAAFGQTADEESLKNAIAISEVRTGFAAGGYRDVPVEPVVIKSISVIE